MATLIRIQQYPAPTRQGAPNATLSFDHGEEYPICIADPFTIKEEDELAWYFEEHLRFPFLNHIRARDAARSIAHYGETLFKQVFADSDAYARYKTSLEAGLATLQFEIAGSPSFHALHWEALKDPRLPHPLVHQASMVRKNLKPQVVHAKMRPSPTINLLIVTARPFGKRDVSYRTISRPLVDALRQARIPTNIDIVRPGTYRALVDHLEAMHHRLKSDEPGGYYHVIHFDVHGAVLSNDELQLGHQTNRYTYNSRYGRPDLVPFEGKKGFLFFEGEQDDQSEPVEASELAQLLLSYQIPIAILNACQSGMATGLAEQEASLGSRLMEAGIQLVLAMGYSITVSAAELLMTKLYQHLFAGEDLLGCIRRARLELANDKVRRAYFDESIDLEDWLLPVIYQNQSLHLQIRGFIPEETRTLYQPPEPTYGFVGRDLDILHVEKRLLTRRNLLLVRGMGGAGKTTFLQHLGTWWQTTHFIDQVCYFGYDQQAWNRQQLITSIARHVFGELIYLRDYQPFSLDIQQARLTQYLRAHRHLLILDNLESITGTHLAIQNTLPPEEQRALHSFLADLVGGKTFVILGSRADESWLAKGTFAENIYELSGLDPEAASILANRILERHRATRYLQDEKLGELILLLDGFPLALEVILANLAHQTPAEVLQALQEGDVQNFSAGATEARTENMLRCIDYSHSNLSPTAQQLLLCLAPFTSVFCQPLLEKYSGFLGQQLLLASLPFEQWPTVVQEAKHWGLVEADPQMPAYYHLQPILPYFLRTRLHAPEHADLKAAIETAFRQVYDPFGSAHSMMQDSKDPQERQSGYLFTSLEDENLLTALTIALRDHLPVWSYYKPLFGYLYHAIQDHRRNLALSEWVREQLEAYPDDKLTDKVKDDLALVMDRVAVLHLELKHYKEAEQIYKKELALRESNTSYYGEEQLTDATASIFQQLGMLAQEQREWVKAEAYYQLALRFKIESQDRSSQAGTYHGLGVTAQQQGKLEEAENYYQQALQIRIESQDPHAQADTYHNLGAIAQEQGKLEEAENYYQQALQIKIESRDPHAQASTYYYLGRIAQERRKWKEAQSYYQHALQICIEFQDRYNQSKPYHGLGRVAQEQGKWEEAENYYQQALQIYIESQDRYEQAISYGQLGRVAEDQQHWQQAKEHSLTAFQLFAEFNDTHNAGKVFGSLARVWQASKDQSIPATIAPIFGIAPEEVEAGLRESLKKQKDVSE